MTTRNDCLYDTTADCRAARARTGAEKPPCPIHHEDDDDCIAYVYLTDPRAHSSAGLHGRCGRSLIVLDFKTDTPPADAVEAAYPSRTRSTRCHWPAAQTPKAIPP